MENFKKIAVVWELRVGLSIGHLNLIKTSAKTQSIRLWKESK